MSLRIPLPDSPRVIDAERHADAAAPSSASISTIVPSSTPREPALEEASARRPLRASRSSPPSREPPVIVGVAAAADRARATKLPACRPSATTSSTSSTALRSRLTCAQSSTLTLSSAVAAGPGRSSCTRSTIRSPRAGTARRKSRARSSPRRGSRSPEPARRRRSTASVVELLDRRHRPVTPKRTQAA